MMMQSLFLLLAAVPPNLHDIDWIEIDAARYSVDCSADVFRITLDAFGEQEDAISFADENRIRCEAGGFVFEAHIDASASQAGSCAAATAGRIDVSINGRNVLGGLFADYCRGRGFTAFEFLSNRLSACGYGGIPGSSRNERVAGCVDYGDAKAFIDSGLRITGTPFEIVESASLPPAPSQAEMDRQAECEHWLGEEPYDEARAKEIADAIKRTCGSGNE